MEKRQAECDWTIFLSYSLSVCFLCPFPSLPIHMSGSHDSPLTGLLTVIAPDIQVKDPTTAEVRQQALQMSPIHV